MNARLVESILEIFSLAVKVVVAGVFLYFAGGLTLRATVAIVVLLALVGSWSWQRPSSSFTLYEVKIIPRVGMMLAELGLTTTQDWERITQEPPPAVPWTSRHLEFGITAVVLSAVPRQGLPTKTVHWISSSSDMGRNANVLYDSDKVEYSANLDFLKFQDSRYPRQDCFNWSPEFFIERGEKDYELGIEVNESWWSDNKERLESEGFDKKAHFVPQVGRTRIVLAVLPDVFQLLDEKDWEKQSAKKKREEIGQELLSTGWNTESIGFTSNIEYYFSSMRNFGEWHISKFADVGVKLLTF